MIYDDAAAVAFAVDLHSMPSLMLLLLMLQMTMLLLQMIMSMLSVATNLQKMAHTEIHHATLYYSL